MPRTRIQFGDHEYGQEWIVVYHLGNPEFDDDFETSNTVEVSLLAEDIDTAVRYAQQYMRKKQTDEETADEWSDAQILSVELH